MLQNVSGMVADDGVAVGIWHGLDQSVQFLFPVSDGRAAILIYDQLLAMSNNFGNA